MFRFGAFPYTLHFRFEAGTSRGVLTQKQGWLIRLSNADNPHSSGLGECSLIPGLSPDKPDELLRLFAHYALEGIDPHSALSEIGHALPALAFALETAMTDLEQGGMMRLFSSDFTLGHKGIPINGLIWMGDIGQMKARVKEKIEQGFDTIKLKIGALHFDDELELLREIRRHYSPRDIILRLDANGAFEPSEALEKLKRLSQFHIHSVEQPIRAGHPEAMATICQQSAIPIALDEELVGVPVEQAGMLLQNIRPHYIILKPSLLGGFSPSKVWIDKAEQLNIGWWVTSALESNVGLNAIAQWTATLPTQLAQGLGTGQLYHNNFASPLYIREARLWHSATGHWEIPF